MEVRELQYFVAVAEELHFARAAERVGIHQSPLSKAITQMERRLGVRLFIRTRRRTQLTAIGESFLVDARRILAEVDAARRHLLAAASGHRGRLRIALAEDLAHPRLSKLISETRAAEPSLDIEVTHANLAAQLADLRAGRLDLGFVLDGIDVYAMFHGMSAERRWGWAGQDVQVAQLWTDVLVTVVRADSPIAARPSAKLQDLANATLIVTGETSACHFYEPLARPSPVERVANISVLLTLVSTGQGIGLMSAAQAETLQWTELVTRPLESPAAEVQTLLLRRNGDQSTLVARFAERAQKSLKLKAK